MAGSPTGLVYKIQNAKHAQTQNKPMIVGKHRQPAQYAYYDTIIVLHTHAPRERLWNGT